MNDAKLEDRLQQVLEASSVDLLDAELGEAVRAYRRVDELFELVRQPVHVAATQQFRAAPKVPGFDQIQFLARGGLGVVYKAYDPALHRWVALKFISSERPNPTEIKRFRSEAEAAAKLDHPNIVPIYGMGDFRGQPYFSMAFVEGQDLSQSIADRPLDSRRSAEILAKVSDALHYAHQQGIVHRDIKPANIMIDRFDQPRVMDFGLAKRIETESGFTATGQILGTPSYMAPEQAAGGHVGPWSDVYSLGALLYHLLTGRPPFQAANVLETLRQLRDGEVLAPRKLNPGIPKDLETIALKCLERTPARRYTAGELKDELQRYLNGEPIHARQVPPLVRWARWCKRHPARVFFGAAAASILIAVATGWVAMQIWALAEVAQADRTRAEAAQRVAEQEQALAQRERERALTAQRREAQQRAIAEQEKATAEHERSKVIATERTARRLLYGAHMQAAGSFGGIAGAMPLIKKYTNPTAEEDFRSFEWYYLWKLCHSASLTFPRSPTALASVAVSDDGELLAAGSKAGLIIVRDSTNGRVRRTWQAHQAGVNSLAFSPDGRELLSGGGDRVVKVWNWSTNDLVWQHEHPAPLRSATISPGGTMIATGSDDGLVRVWERPFDTAPRELAGHQAGVRCVAFSPTNEQLASGSIDKRVLLWDLGTEKAVHHIEVKSPVFQVVYSPDGAYVATGSFDGSVRLWNSKSGAFVSRANAHRTAVLSVDFDSSGERVFSTSSDGRVEQWRVPDLQNWDSVFAAKAAVRVATLPRDRIVTVGNDGDTRIWGSTDTLNNFNWIYTVAFSPDGKTVAASCQDGHLRLWGVAGGRLINTLKVAEAPVRAVTFLPRQPCLVTAGGPRLAIWNRETLELIADYELSSPVHAFSVSGDGSTLIGGCADGSVQLWEIGDRQLRAQDRLLMHRGTVQDIAVSPRGTQFATAGTDGRTLRWHLEERRVIQELPARDRGVNAVAFSPDGRLLATGGQDGIVSIFIGDATQPRWTFLAHTNAVYDIEFTLDSKRLLTAAADGRIRVWDVATRLSFPEEGFRAPRAGEPVSSLLVLTLDDHRSPVWTIAFSPDGRTLASGDVNGIARLWRSATPEEVSAQQLANPE